MRLKGAPELLMMQLKSRVWKSEKLATNETFGAAGAEHRIGGKEEGDSLRRRNKRSVILSLPVQTMGSRAERGALSLSLPPLSLPLPLLPPFLITRSFISHNFSLIRPWIQTTLILSIKPIGFCRIF